MIELIGKTVVYTGRRFSVERRSYRYGNSVFEREIVNFPESVVILPLLDTTRMILIKQYRPSINDYIYEAPAGVVEPGESIRETAYRELIEETGYRPGELIEIGYYYTTPGYSTEKMHFFIARKLEYVGIKPEKYEIIEPVVFELSSVIDMIKSNVINDLKTVMIIIYYISNYNVANTKTLDVNK